MSHRMKAILFYLIRAFKFDLAVPASEVWHYSGNLIRPYVGDLKEAQMPLILSLADD